MDHGLEFKQINLCSFAGLRKAVGESLALIVSKDEKVPKSVRDVVLIHVARVVLLNLLNDASTLCLSSLWV